MDEFFSDIEACRSTHLLIFIDSSYSGLYAHAINTKAIEDKLLSDEIKWDNTVLFASTNDDSLYSWRGEMTKHWSKLQPTSPLSWVYHNVSLNDLNVKYSKG